MMGFTYRGVHTGTMKVHYVPDATQRGDFCAQYSTVSTDRAWGPGGYFLYNRMQTREFSLDCFYDHITSVEREKIIKWFGKDTSGDLIFDERPYAAYFVRPTKRVEFRDYTQQVGEENLYSGTFTVTLTAFYPLAKLLYSSLDGHDTAILREETGLMDSSNAPNDIQILNYTGNPALGSDVYVGYNPGSEIGNTVIEFEGNTGSSPLKIHNLTTDDVCTIKQGLTTAAGVFYRISSRTGRFEKVTGDTAEIDFAYHDDGYICYDSCLPIVRDEQISATEGSKTIIASEAVFTSDMKWNYVRLNGKWMLIDSVQSPTQATLNLLAEATETVTTNILRLNHITVEAASDANIKRLEIKCEAEVR